MSAGLEQPSTKAWLQRRAPKETAWVELAWNRHSAQVWTYVARRLGPAVAGDVVSKVFLVAWRRRQDEPRKPLPWLYGIARHVIQEEYRHKARSEKMFEPLAQFDTPTSRLSPNESEVVERAMAVNALKALDEADRELLLLTAWEGLSGADAARVMGLSHAAFRVRKLRARRRLESLLAEPNSTTSWMRETDDE